MQGGSLYHFYDGLWYDNLKSYNYAIIYHHVTLFLIHLNPNTINMFEISVEYVYTGLYAKTFEL